MRLRIIAALAGSALVGCITSDPINGAGGGADDGSNDAGSGASGGGTIEDGGSGGSTGVAAPTCGDGTCSVDEDCASCPADCECGGPVCGDGTCDDPAETCTTCDVDCGVCPTCGDGTCDPTEDCDTCYEDCGVCACVPDGKEPNNGSPSATPLAFGVELCKLSVCSADVDWFKIPVTTGFTAKATFFQAEGDLDLEVYSGVNFDYITGSYSGDDDEMVTLSGLQSANYYLRVYGYQGAENPDYCIRVDP
ncbi:MAG TPA: PPC domain-containing protein [Polyangiaceae bacterium]|nr:PPC domain-containing protein [Polyangiaceae bacterium]